MIFTSNIYCTNVLIVLVKIMLCSKLHGIKVFNLKVCFYQMGAGLKRSKRTWLLALNTLLVNTILNVNITSKCHALDITSRYHAV